MEVGRAPRWLKLVCGAWIGIVFGIVAACHLLPRDVLRLIG
ncbi:prokaryotic Cytochrome C oxidase subunit IV family protein [Burkholderia pseudomallei]|nr:prokaryotic Cytochrome C oxidase subunit IV family protein [Burkholderia pseudomallei]CAJ6692509.1 prokaryotic Cytochrome C oxidase subunit IV family protein [Burkholderia pseudomallei]CAJ9184473.1 prokaryotic Cytochrome C oxidase subunit IV family protein [Burkholderia pseudomallei]CAJ9893996.1 prokaryotic Cytochrome C oxidase subunit IV family protein [Burkholderia pseudomallei]